MGYIHSTVSAYVYHWRFARPIHGGRLAADRVANGLVPDDVSDAEEY
jgi:hypothetical protein